MLALDSNILVYAISKTGADAREAAGAAIVERAFAAPTCVPLQVLGEFLNVSRNKRLVAPHEAIAFVEEWRTVFDTPATAPRQLSEAALLAERFRMQYFEALICVVAREAGATTLLSEDMHDGLDVGGLTIVNPFAPANAARVEAALTRAS